MQKMKQNHVSKIIWPVILLLFSNVYAGADGMSPLSDTAPLPTPFSPPPIQVISPVQTTLNAKEQQGVKLANQWKMRASLPQRGEGGSVVFLYGATLPSIVCAPLYACNLQLQPGETVRQIDLADNVRWKIAPSVFGQGEQATTVLVIKPTDAGLTTNVVVATDRRVYIVKLISRLKEWMPLVSFAYPDEVNREWSAYYAREAQMKAQTVLPETGQNIADLDFNYRIEGHTAWCPLRVYNDGLKTYIQLPANIQSGAVPALVVIGHEGEKELVNYRLNDHTFVVDQVFAKAALISGVGRAQQSVLISRTGR